MRQGLTPTVGDGWWEAGMQQTKNPAGFSVSYISVLFGYLNININYTELSP